MQACYWEIHKNTIPHSNSISFKVSVNKAANLSKYSYLLLFYFLCVYISTLSVYTTLTGCSVWAADDLSRRCRKAKGLDVTKTQRARQPLAQNTKPHLLTPLPLLVLLSNTFLTRSFSFLLLPTLQTIPLSLLCRPPTSFLLSHLFLRLYPAISTIKTWLQTKPPSFMSGTEGEKRQA